MIWESRDREENLGCYKERWTLAGKTRSGSQKIVSYQERNHSIQVVLEPFIALPYFSFPSKKKKERKKVGVGEKGRKGERGKGRRKGKRGRERNKNRDRERGRKEGERERKRKEGRKGGRNLTVC